MMQTRPDPGLLGVERARFSAVQRAPFGAVGVRIEGDQIAELVFLDACVLPSAPGEALALEAEQFTADHQLIAFFDDPRQAFDLPLKPVGTPFRRRVWQAIAAIPCGGTRAYGDLARELGSAPRAVGQACGANFHPLVIPCHRVVAATGLGGFARHADGFHPGVKRWLLAHEARCHL